MIDAIRQREGRVAYQPSLAYLATPYSHPSATVRAQRYDLACRASAALLARGFLVLSPIAHGHGIALASNRGTSWETWEALDRRLLASCDRLVVLTLDGWKRSKGVKAEIAIAEALGLPVEYLHPDALLGGAP